MTNEEHRKIVDAIIDAHKDNEMGGKYAKAFDHGVQSAFNRVCKALEDIKKQQSDWVLEKIRAEMEQRKKNSGGDPSRDLAFNVCLQIIDKYRKGGAK